MAKTMKTKLILLMALLAFSPCYAKSVKMGGDLVATDGTTVAGARGITFIFSSDYTGTVAGVTFDGSTDSSYSPPVQTGDTVAAIAYVVTTGNIRIIYVR